MALANKISLNVAKTELIIFRKANTNMPSIKIKLNGKRLYPSNSIKYLGVYLDFDLSGITHCKEILPKLRRTNGMLSKARHNIFNKKISTFNIIHNVFFHHNIWSTSLGSSG